MFRFIKWLLLARILLMPGEIFSISKNDFAIKMISGPLFHSDQNECTSGIGPRAVYVAIEMCNNSGTTQSNISIRLVGFTSPGYALAGNQPEDLFPRNPANASTCDTLYWFCTYPCAASSTNIVFRISDSDDGTSYEDTVYAVSSSRELSASAGGFVRSTTLTLKDTANQTTCFQVTYGLSKLLNTNQVFLQPVANLNFRADCFQLTRASVVYSDDGINGCIPVGPCPLYYSIGTTCGASPSWVVVVEYCFRVKCPFTTTPVIPYASATSGNDLKYTIATQSLLLPVELLEFNASENNGSVNVHWKTASDNDVDYFEVERSSDGISFETLYRKSPRTNSRQAASHDYLDDSPQGMNYYRLKIVEKDGNISYSPMREVRMDVSDAIELSFFPNPVKDKLNINVRSGVFSGTVPVRILDASGSIVAEQELSSAHTSVDLSSLPGGMYFVSCTVNGKPNVRRIVKE